MFLSRGRRRRRGRDLCDRLAAELRPSTSDQAIGVVPTGSDAHGFHLAYQATARVPGCHPSIRVRGRGPLLGCLTKVWIREQYRLPMGNGLSTALPEPLAGPPGRPIEERPVVFLDSQDANRVDALSGY